MDQDLSTRSRLLRQVSDVQQALEDNRISLDVQQIFSTRGVAAAEAAPGGALRFELLLRLRDSRGSVVRPTRYLPALERFQLAPQLDRWVVVHLLEWLQLLPPPQLARIALCAVNLSSASLRSNAFVSFLIRRFAAPEAAPLAAKICFEVKESDAVDDGEALAAFAHALDGTGCRIALEGFGTGWRSFATLKRLPLALVKLDSRLLQSAAGDDRADAAIVRAICDVSHALDIDVIAPHVENAQTFERLGRFGIDYAQGYYLERPRPLAQLSAR